MCAHVFFGGEGGGVVRLLARETVCAHGRETQKERQRVTNWKDSVTQGNGEEQCLRVPSQS